MKPKQRRLYFILGGLAVLGVAVALISSALRDNLVFFFSPTEVVQKGIEEGKHFRVGGLVEEGTVKRGSQLDVTFTVTDGAEKVMVQYKGILPDLFREGQGVVAEGAMQNGVFVATNVLAKHDEKYMPPEVADALKKSGHWEGDAPQ